VLAGCKVVALGFVNYSRFKMVASLVDDRIWKDLKCRRRVSIAIPFQLRPNKSAINLNPDREDSNEKAGIDCDPRSGRADFRVLPGERGLFEEQQR
jgi:hypothetical protein